MINSINLTNEARASFPRSSGAASIEIQSAFGKMADMHEPAVGLGRYMTPDVQQEILTHD